MLGGGSGDCTWALGAAPPAPVSLSRPQWAGVPGGQGPPPSRAGVSGLQRHHRVRGTCPGVLTMSCAPSRAVPCCAIACTVPTWGPCGWRGPNTSRRGLGHSFQGARRLAWDSGRLVGPGRRGRRKELGGHRPVSGGGRTARGGHSPAPSRPPARGTARFWRWLCRHLGSWAAAAWQMGSWGGPGSARPPLPSPVAHGPSLGVGGTGHKVWGLETRDEGCLRGEVEKQVQSRALRPGGESGAGGVHGGPATVGACPVPALEADGGETGRGAQDSRAWGTGRPETETPPRTSGDGVRRTVLWRRCQIRGLLRVLRLRLES